MIPFVTINLDKHYKLRFGMGAQIEFEQLTHMKLGQLARELEHDPSIEIMGKALWIMMRRENKALTLEDVCELVDQHADNLTYIVESVSNAIEIAWEVKDRPNAPTP